MAESRKVLVAFDPEKPTRSSNDFLVPVKNDGGDIELYGTRSKRRLRYGMVILTSRAVTENDLFAKLVDTGIKVPHVTITLDILGKFLEAMNSVKIGNIVEIAGTAENDVSLVVVSNTPSGFGR